MVEYVISRLLMYSTLDKSEFVVYETEEIEYKNRIFYGCSSLNFLPEGWQLITLERLFKTYYGESLHSSIYKITSLDERVKFLVEQTIRITGLKDFGTYLSKMFSIDALFLNEDRYTHNIAVLIDTTGNFHYCPFFDNGAALLADSTIDYPLGSDIYELIDTISAKPICQNFDEQLSAVEKIYGQQIKFDFKQRDINKVLSEDAYYSNEIKDRVCEIVLEQKRKYQYMFTDN